MATSPARTDPPRLGGGNHRRRGSKNLDLLGYSMGARIALQIAIDHPEKVRRLILISATPGLTDDAEREERKRTENLTALMLEEDGIGPSSPGGNATRYSNPTAPLPTKVAAELRAAASGTTPAAWPAVRAPSIQGNSPNNWDRLGELDLLVLLLAGEGYVTDMQAMSERMRAMS